MHKLYKYTYLIDLISDQLWQVTLPYRENHQIFDNLQITTTRISWVRMLHDDVWQIDDSLDDDKCGKIGHLPEDMVDVKFLC